MIDFTISSAQKDDFFQDFSRSSSSDFPSSLEDEDPLHFFYEDLH
jgi:hypothetical protein